MQIVKTVKMGVQRRQKHRYRETACLMCTRMCLQFYMYFSSLYACVSTRVNADQWQMPGKLFAIQHHCSLLLSLCHRTLLFSSFLFCLSFCVTNLQIVQSGANKLQKYDAIDIDDDDAAAEATDVDDVEAQLAWITGWDCLLSF